MNHSLFAYHAQHNADQTALSYLEDIWVEKDPKEHRCFSIAFHFKENQFFNDKVLKKEYKFVQPPAAETEQADENGITESMLDFSWDRDVEISTIKIDWKDPEKALTKVYPRELEKTRTKLPILEVFSTFLNTAPTHLRLVLLFQMKFSQRLLSTSWGMLMGTSRTQKKRMMKMMMRLRLTLKSPVRKSVVFRNLSISYAECLYRTLFFECM